MFEKERAEIRILSNIADAQGLGHARDLLRSAEHEFAERSKALEEQNESIRRAGGTPVYARAKFGGCQD